VKSVRPQARRSLWRSERFPNIDFLKKEAMIKSFITCLLFICYTVTVTAQNNYKEVTLPELMQKTQQGEKGYIILDVRSAGEYMDTVAGGRHIGIGRIKKAINIPIQDLLQKPETIKKLEQYKNEDVYVICSHSYRSRRISNLLLQNGFASVNNVKGGMSEWYRNYDELNPFAAAMYENNIAYRNMAPSQLYQKLQANEPIELIGFMNAPRFFFDSLLMSFYPKFPDIKNTSYYRAGDSLQILEKLKTNKNKTIVLFNAIGGGGNETADWLVQKGFNNVYYLVGSLSGFYEYMINYQSLSAINKHMAQKSGIEFFTPLSFCKTTPKNVQWIDLRHDTTFNKITRGTKLDYKTLKDAVNFPFYKTAGEFEQKFTDKSKFYLLIPEDGYTGMDLADALQKKGYYIGWLIGGIERWEWYTNNIDLFTCRDYLVK
jgi:rhodanese-related sulfurtransferase